MLEACNLPGLNGTTAFLNTPAVELGSSQTRVFLQYFSAIGHIHPELSSKRQEEQYEPAAGPETGPLQSKAKDQRQHKPSDAS